MLEILQYVLGGFWRFAGTVILLAVFGDVVAQIVRALRGSDVQRTITGVRVRDYVGKREPVSGPISGP